MSYPRINDLSGFNRVKIRRINKVKPILSYQNNFYYCGREGVWIDKALVVRYSKESTGLGPRPLCPRCGSMLRTHRVKKNCHRRPPSPGFCRTVDRLGFLVNANEEELERFKGMSDHDLMTYFVQVFRKILNTSLK